MKLEYSKKLPAEDFTRIACESCKMDAVPCRFVQDHRKKRCEGPIKIVFGLRMAVAILLRDRPRVEVKTPAYQALESLPILFENAAALESAFPDAYADAEAWLASWRYEPTFGKDISSPEFAGGYTKRICDLCGLASMPLTFLGEHVTRHCPGKFGTIFGPRLAMQAVAFSIQTWDEFALSLRSGGVTASFSHAELAGMFPAACAIAEATLSYDDQRKEVEARRKPHPSSSLIQERARVAFQNGQSVRTPRAKRRVARGARLGQRFMAGIPLLPPKAVSSVKVLDGLPTAPPIPMDVEVPWVDVRRKPPMPAVDLVADGGQRSVPTIKIGRRLA